LEYIDLEKWPRKEIYRFYGSLDFPHFNVCADMDVTQLQSYIKERGLSIFTAVLFGVCKAANSISEIRHRIRGEKIVVHDVVHPSFTVLTEDKLFGFCETRYTDDIKLFFKQTEEAMANAKREPSLKDGPGRDDYLFVSTIPWVRFTSISHATHMHPVDSIPRISWGKITQEKDRVIMPLSIQVHHGLADGYHVGRFFNLFQEWADLPDIELAELS
jgi:chloramphenicol O-acetyltransferase type A